MNVRIIRDLAGVDAFEPKWTELISDSSFHAPYYSWDWYRIWWDHFGKDLRKVSCREPYLISVESDGGRTEAIAPMMREKGRLRGLPAWELRLATAASSPRGGFIFRNGAAHAEVIDAIMGFLQQHRREWDLITLSSLDESTSAIDHIEACCRHRRLPVVRRTAISTPFITIGNDFEEFLHATLNRERRQSTGRKVRKLCKQNFRIAEFNRPENIDEGIELTFAVCRASWKASIGADITSSEMKMGFFRDLARHFCQKGQVRIWVAILDDKPIASELHLTDGKKLYFLANDFDQAYEKHSPGAVLLYRVLEQLHQEPIDEFDFGGDAYGYKMKWASGVRKHYNLEIFNNRLYSRFLYQAKVNIMPAIHKYLSRRTFPQPAAEETVDDAQ